MARRRKLEQELDKGGWFELSGDAWKDPGEILPKPKLLAHANFPSPLVASLRKAKFDLKTAQELGLAKLDDTELLHKAGRRGRILITLDGDFWSDLRFPLHQCHGLIYLDSHETDLQRSFGLNLLLEFLQSFGGRWAGMKIRVCADRLLWKIRSYQGRKIVYEVKIFGRRAYARELPLVDTA